MTPGPADVAIAAADVVVTGAGTAPAGTASVVFKDASNATNFTISLSKDSGLAQNEKVDVIITSKDATKFTVNGKSTDTIVDIAVSGIGAAVPVLTGFTVAVPASQVGAADVTPVATAVPAGAPSGTIVWTTSDATIATIVSGKVHAVAAGQVDIIATSSGKTGKETITVSAARSVPTGTGTKTPGTGGTH